MGEEIMEKTDVLEKLQLIFRDVFSDDTLELTTDLSADDIENWSSLTYMELTLAMEQTFSVTFNLTDLNRMKEIDDIIAVLFEKLKDDTK
jgi:acyl carrier protein